MAGRHDYTAIFRLDLGHLHQQGDFTDLTFRGFSVNHVTKGGEVATDNLRPGGLAAHFIIANAKTGHVHTHVRWRLIGILAVNAFKYGIQDREDFNVTVVVDSSFTVSIKVERIDHVDIVEVGGRRFIGHIDRMFEGDAPDGEGFKLGITGLYATLVLLV